VHTQHIIEAARNPIGGGAEVGRAALQSLHLPQDKLSEPELCDWIAGAAPGQSIQYHEGFLMLDRSASESTLPAADRIRLHAVARRAWIACELGLVHLFSLKLADCHYRYIAVRSTSRLTPAGVRERLRSKTSPTKPTVTSTAH
jgi:hypothetical protein